MSENLNQDEKRDQKPDFSAKPHELSRIKKVIGVMSGKGGVGKSLVTSMLAVMMNRRGHQTAILDADITGPSIPKAFGIHDRATGNQQGLLPICSATGIKIMSINLLLENDTDPVVWRGPLLAGTVKQFWTDVIWGDVDFMFIDMPPGTGDVPLTVFQSLPVDGIIIVTSPQELVSMIVSKAVKMAEMMGIPVVGLVENMAYFKCPDCGREHSVFGESHIEKIAQQYNLEILARLPVEPGIAAACDGGLIEYYKGDWPDNVAERLAGSEQSTAIRAEKEEGDRLKIAVASEGGMVTQHFGHCESFEVFDSVNRQIIDSQSVPNPGHRPGFLPNFLNDLGVNVIISGGMGAGAIDIFNEKNIEVITGAQGDARVAAELYLKGMLKSTGAVCHDHQHHGECGH